MESLLLNQPWHNWSVKKVLSHFNTDSRHGLSEDEAKLRLVKWGANKLPQRELYSGLKILFKQFRSPLIAVLCIAAIISFFSSDIIDFLLISLAIILNVIIGFIQEQKAQQALAALAKVVVPKVIVVRDGQEVEIPSSLLVPGDLVLVASGERVPADLRLISVTDLEINESPLTGESVPVFKGVEVVDDQAGLADRKNILYQGTLVVKGLANGVVVATGSFTELGKIAVSLRNIKERLTPLQKRIKQLSINISLIILLLGIVIFLVGLIHGQPWLLMMNTAVAVAISAIPEGLLIGVTMILAIGMRRLLKERALVRHLLAAEILGSTTVLCVDKTGTLTEGQMRLAQLITLSGQIKADELPNSAKALQDVSYSSLLLLEAAILANEAVIINEHEPVPRWQIRGSYTDKALWLAAGQLGIKPKVLLNWHPRLAQLGFHSSRQYAASIHQHKTFGETMFLKGAPEVVFKGVTEVYNQDSNKKFDDEQRHYWHKMLTELTGQGWRVLAVGYRVLPNGHKAEPDTSLTVNNIVLLGLVAFSDPLRLEIAGVLNQARNMGLLPVILTGDNVATAKWIARQLGMKVTNYTVMDGEKLEKLSNTQLRKIISQVHVFARVMPQHKMRIVKVWQSLGAVVAMTGDGINDAMAMEAADIGVGLGSGTAVAKETADLVLLNDNFKTLVTAVTEGRVIFDNIRKVTLYLLSDCYAAVIIVITSLFAGWPLPLTAAQILWINILTDGLPTFALGFEQGEKEVLYEPPPKTNEPLLGKRRWFLIGLISLLLAVLPIGLFWLYWTVTGDEHFARTVAFVALAVSSLFYVFSIRSLRRPLFKQNLFSNPLLIISVLISIVLQLAAVYWHPLQLLLGTRALGATEWSIILLYSVILVGILEMAKILRRRVKLQSI